MAIYDKDYTEHVLKELENNVLIESELQVGIGSTSISSVSISVIDKSPQRAAEMANDFLVLLEEKIVALNTLKAGNNRAFLAQRVAQNMKDLTAAEETLNAFQTKYGAIEITEQAAIAIAAAAEIKAELMRAEIAKEALLPRLNRSHSEIEQLDDQIRALKKKYAQLHEGENIARTGTDVFFPIDQIPDIGMQYYRYLRDVEIQNTLLKMLVPLFEQAKIQETKTIPVLRIVDKAVPPTYKYKPKRALIVIGILAVSLAFCFLYIFSVEYMRRIKETDAVQHDKLLALRQSLRFAKDK
jgi:uncharacterized protein involved in exopolysaccharide biosynthesis